jgi:hypothetical protein
MNLPLHVILNIVSFLSGWEMFRTMTVCKAWKKKIEEIIEIEVKKKDEGEIRSIFLKEITKYETKVEKSVCITTRTRNNIFLGFFKIFDPKIRYEVVRFKVHKEDYSGYSLFFDKFMVLYEIRCGQPGLRMIVKVKLIGKDYLLSWLKFGDEEIQFENGELTSFSMDEVFDAWQIINSWFTNNDPLHLISLPTDNFRYKVDLDVFSRYDIRKTKFFSCQQP